MSKVIMMMSLVMMFRRESDVFMHSLHRVPRSESFKELMCANPKGRAAT